MKNIKVLTFDLVLTSIQAAIDVKIIVTITEKIVMKSELNNEDYESSLDEARESLLFSIDGEYRLC